MMMMIPNHLPAARRISNPTMEEDIVVGFEDEAEKIIDRLETKSSLYLNIVSIVGMPGQGKTTLAKKIYNDIRSRFHVSAWCCISQGYVKRKLLLDILNDTLNHHELPNVFNEMKDGDLEQVLYKSLKGRRYLIVLDDIWDAEPWQSLQSCFPDDHNRSRILMTSRMQDLGLQAIPGSRIRTHFLRQLNYDESKELIQKLLLRNNGCPPNLRNISMWFAHICKGLPLAIVTVVGILTSLEPDRWVDFAKSLTTTSLLSGTDQCTELLELSYVHLPDCLKPCLLYFASFLQDEEVLVSRLIWLWMAEGLVQKITKEEEEEEKSVENVAMEMLINLINRSLVKVVKQTSQGGIKTCSVHDLVHQFCLTKAEEENFLQQPSLYQKPFPLPEQPPRRLCVYSWNNLQSFHGLSSLKFFPNTMYHRLVRHRRLLPLFSRSGEANDETFFPIKHGIPPILCHFKLLKVLDLSKTRCSVFPAEVETLVQLRYLALVGYVKYVPPTIVKLQNLETFILSGSTSGISLPYTLMNMAKLRHLQVLPRAMFNLTEQNLAKYGSCNLVTFSALFVSTEQEMVNIIRRMPYLIKLKCIFSASWHFRQDQGRPFVALANLSRLESLKLHSTCNILHELELSPLSSLKKLTISGFHLPWGSISKLAEIPNLEVLKLVHGACVGETWDMEPEEEFTKLRFLKLENLDIVNWNACSDNFPCLRQLVLDKCSKLQGMPSSVGEISSLENIEVKWCHISVATAAKVLEEEIEGLKVFTLAECNNFPSEFSNLTKLESLKLHSIGKVRYQLELNNFPSNLRKLTLSNFCLPWERISVFAELQNLEVLRLLSKACEGETWDMGEEVFSNLQFLKLENLDIVHWNAYSENFPRLRKLVLNRCKKLEGIPMGMEEIDTLRVIEVNWCKESVATSAEALKLVMEGDDKIGYSHLGILTSPRDMVCF